MVNILDGVKQSIVILVICLSGFLYCCIDWCVVRGVDLDICFSISRSTLYNYQMCGY